MRGRAASPAAQRWGTIILQRLEAMGRSQSWLAAEIAKKEKLHHLDPSYIGKFVRGVIDRPSPARLRAIAEVLGLDAAELLRDFGYYAEPDNDPIIPELRAVLGGMTPEQQRAVLGLISHLPLLQRALGPLLCQTGLGVTPAGADDVPKEMRPGDAGDDRERRWHPYEGQD